MAPAQPRKLVPKDRFSTLFSTLKTQSYFDPSSRGPGSHAIRSIAWSPLGSLIATGAADKTLRVWNPEKADVKYSTELRGHTGAIEQVAWNPTREAELASVSLDGTCRFWEVRTKTCLATVQLGSDGLSLSWAPDGGLVMAGSRKSKSEDISADSHNVTAEFQRVSEDSPDATEDPLDIPEDAQDVFEDPQDVSGTTRRVSENPQDVSEDFLSFDETLTPIAVSTYTAFPALPQITQTNRTIFAPTNASSTTYTLLISTGTGTVKFCTYPKAPSTSTPPELKLLKTIQAHTSSCTSLRLSPNGRFLATGGSDAMVNLWDTRELWCVRGLDRPVGGVRNVSFSWDGHYIVAGSDEGTGVDIADVETGEYIHCLETPVPAQCVAWHPSRYWLAWAGEPGGLKIVGAAGGQL